VPVACEKEALVWLAGREARVYADWKAYTVRKGESLGQLSRRHGVSLAALRRANNKNDNTIKPGELLLVPGKSSRAAQSAAAAPRTGQSGYITVRSGDTLYALARANGRTVEDLRAANALGPRATLRIGQKLRLSRAEATFPQGAADSVPAVPGPSPQEAASEAKFTMVQAGDTLFSLARANNTTVDALRKLNGLTDPSRLRRGQKILLP
jgi:membrane-bound lytic murein transglycosylase D